MMTYNIRDTICMVHQGQSRHFYRTELLIATVIISTQCQNLFGPNPIFLPYGSNKVMNICVLSIFLSISLFFTPYFCLYLNFKFCRLWPPWTISCHIILMNVDDVNDYMLIKLWYDNRENIITPSTGYISLIWVNYATSKVTVECCN